jgi:uncharacterized protein YpmS
MLFLLLQILGPMTLDKKEVITIPKWLVVILSPVIVALVVSFGSMNLWKGASDTKLDRAEQEIEKLDNEKVDRTEFNQLMNAMNRVEDKLDEHMDKGTTRKEAKFYKYENEYQNKQP